MPSTRASCRSRVTRCPTRSATSSASRRSRSARARRSTRSCPNTPSCAKSPPLVAMPATTALAHHLNPFKRKHDAPVAYWSGIVDIGPEAKTFTYHVPDYFAGDGPRYGCREYRRWRLAPSRPRPKFAGRSSSARTCLLFVAPGDIFDVSVTIANNVEGSGRAMHRSTSVSPRLRASRSRKNPMRSSQSPRAATPASMAAACKGPSRQCGHHRDRHTRRPAHESLASHLSIRPPVSLLDHDDQRLFSRQR